LKISDDGGGDEDEKESKQNKGPADADYTPVIQKMNFNFVSCGHICESVWRELPILVTRPSKANEAGPMLPECHIKTAEHPIPIVVVARHARGHVGIARLSSTP
jgi:hypothetical protein